MIQKNIAHLFKKIISKKGELSYVAAMTYFTFAITFFTQVIHARLLGPSDYGVLVSTLAILALIETPLVVRATEISLRQLGKTEYGIDANFIFISRAMRREDILYFFIATMLILASSSWVSKIIDVEHSFFIVMGLLIPAQIGYGIYKSYFIIFNIIPTLVKFEMAYAVAHLFVTTIGYLVYGMPGIALGYVASMLFKTYMAYLFTRAKVILIKDSTVILGRSCSIKDSFHSILRNFLSNGINQVDVIILSLIQGPQTVAIYKVAKSLSALPTKLSQPVWRYLQPKLMQAIQSDDRMNTRKIIFYGGAVLILILVLMLPIALLAGQEFIALVYGQDYVQSYVPFLILLFGVWAFNGLTGWFKFWSAVSDSQRFTSGIYLAMLLTLVSMAFLFGSEGATEMAASVLITFIFFAVVVTVKVLFL
jgi:O-antigen/teichoic acid export membrane protein